jgi:hypothetical protein
MKRDLDLVREILLAVEASDEIPLRWVELDHLGRPDSEIAYHVVLMADGDAPSVVELARSSVAGA